MSDYVKLQASDGQQFNAYVASPAGKPIGALVVLQEIFGVNAQIRSVADAYATDGFLTVAPALFDRIEPGVELGYEGADLQKALSFTPRINVEKSLLDVAAALDYAAASSGRKAGIIGYCFGGTLAWVAAARLHPAAAVGYYGGRIGSYASETLVAPVMLHFGSKDAHIPAAEVERVHLAHPEVEIHWYDAGHGFNRDANASYEPASARLARERSLAFFKKYLG